MILFKISIILNSLVCFKKFYIATGYVQYDNFLERKRKQDYANVI